MKRDLVFSQSSHDLKVTVIPRYLEDESNPHTDFYAWAYTVIIENNSPRTLQLVNRRWKIYDSNGIVTEVHGPGVIGQQPVINPNESFQYTSSAHLHTGFGMMIGDYEMVDASNQESMDVQIPLFSLDSPFSNSNPH